MSSALAYAPRRRVAALMGAFVMVACGTSSTPLPPPAASKPKVAAPAKPAVPAGVESRFPDPGVTYTTPALQGQRDGFTTNAELQASLRTLAKEGKPVVSLLTLGKSQKGAPIEALLFTRSSDTSAAALAASGKPTVLLIGQQHGDEPAGAEALMVVAQELTQGRLQSLLARINVIILPRANPDGAEAGKHAATDGVDIYQDHLLLKTPEAQAQAKLLREYRPLVVVDSHEYAVSDQFQKKFGGVEGYDVLMQYATVANLPQFVTKASEEWFRRPLRASLQQQGLSSEWYFTTSADPADKTLSMGSTRADNGRNVNGLRNAVSFVIETRGAGMGRAHLRRRIHAHETAVGSILRSAFVNANNLKKLRQYVDADVSAQACKGKAVLEAQPTAVEYTVQVLDPATGADKPVVVNWDTSLVLNDSKSRPRPCGYWLAADQSNAVAKLRDLGLKVDKVTAGVSIRGETYRELPGPAELKAEKKRAEVSLVAGNIDVLPGSFYVPLSQPLANLAIAALEPDTPHSYFSSQLVTELRKESRLMTRRGAKRVVAVASTPASAAASVAAN